MGVFLVELLRVRDQAALVFLSGATLITYSLDLEGEHEGGTYAWLWDKVDLSAELANYSFADTEPKPNTTDVLLDLVLKSGEKLKQLILVLFFDALSCVRDLTVHLIGVPVVLDLRRHPSLKCELECIGYQVDGELHQPLIVSKHVLREVIFELQLTIDLLEVGLKLHHLDDVVECAPYVKVLHLLVEFTKLYLSPVDQVVEEWGQQVARYPHGFEALFDFFAQSCIVF